ncbi:TIGR01906 family membrane protein [Carnobacterium divergens]|uniref:TIGR01906 family membrane protein n=1 Tax=Carnobacterium divergens TaxID=2748 RepID=A0A7Z8G4K9_CARDV|nr:TIGR01906 family membrane protein [Carnobacterium divergens]TFI73397.1 TIGR01906 family membrane protein [Carnobacterium divergens]TFI77344.1 TIGR01906 family membrane protein [Carnobacterium divergens]TFI84108.1 TIGR01906 family membrane protein [Carnobacterium divergens]TFI95953.1 TIGR01906 family membrane protein [Carnobacterium divergens]TFJ12257.1 TIGR01906 family membrane protein [Carnobacterium divergens]
MKQNAIQLGGVTLLILFILSISIALTINVTILYRVDISLLAIDQQSGLSKAVLMDNYHHLLSYLNFPWIRSLEMPDFPSSANGLNHFFEVKRLFLVDYLVVLISGIGSLFFIRYLKKHQLGWTLIRPFQVLIVAPVVLGVVMMISFDQLFIVFHEVLFNNEDWMFNPSTDPIINVLPEAFFMHCFILAILLMEIQFIIGYYWSKKQIRI